MKLEELIYKRFLNSENLVKYLAKFNEIPSVFYSEAPGDSQKEWGRESQYPRIVYNYDLQANEERHSTGTLSVSLLCENTAKITPETIEPFVIDCLRDVLLKPDEGIPYCFAWARTDPFEIPGQAMDSRIIGAEIRFDILEYPNQETTDPDPIGGICRSIKDFFRCGKVVGIDRLESIEETSAGQPVFYCRIESIEKKQETNTVIRYDCKIAVHILCPDSAVRRKLTKALAEKLSMDGEVILADNSPMSFERVQVNYGADYLKTGQLSLTGHYGVIRWKWREKKATLTAGTIVTNY